MAATTGPRALSQAIRHAARQHNGSSRRHIATAATAVEYNDPEPIIPDSPPPPAQPALDRRQAVREAKPFSDFLTDTFARQHDYLRISVTERCNLRCLYCMPEEGIDLAPSRELLTTPEIVYLSALFVNQGVNKIRLTGGEPTVRKDIVPLMQQIGGLSDKGLRELALTTNGISLVRKLDKMVEAGLTGVNISLDTLDPFQFQLLTRRQGFEAVTKSISRIQEMNKAGAGIKLKINAVVMRGLNDHQILPFVEKTRDEDIEIRFIEYMPFDGNKWSQNKMLPYEEMLEIIRAQYPDIGRLRGAKNDTSKTWQVPGFKGRVGFITSMTHNFCGTCNRLRITSDGNLKVCLHGEDEVSLRDMLRSDLGGDPMDDAAFEALRQLELDRRQRNGSGPGLRFDGEEAQMTTESRLLDVIGQAVKRKKAKHAGMGVLENLKNRPMIKIGKRSSIKPSQQSSTLNFPCSRIPTHLLPTQPLSHSQIRWSSSDSRSEQSPFPFSEEGQNNDSKEEPDSFGFQSLRGLLRQPEPRPRYSRPREEESEGQDSASAGRPVRLAAQRDDGVEGEKGREGEGRVDVTFFRASDAASGRSSSDPGLRKGLSKVAESQPEGSQMGFPGAAAPAVAREDDLQPQQTTIRRRPGRNRAYHENQRRRAMLRAQNGASALAPTSLPGLGEVGTERVANESDAAVKAAAATAQIASRPSIRKTVFPEDPGALVADTAIRREGGRRISRTWRNPHAASRYTGGTAFVRLSSRRQPEPERPWGISRDDMEMVGSVVEPDETRSTESGTVAPVRRGSYTPPSASTPSAKHKTSDTGKGLTHLSSAGEAHMVDVGPKSATRRVAIAMAYVAFSNAEPYRLISENSNKKGDVLSVARIAGIMAAKRTSDLIPLCHPVAISKVEVDVQLSPHLNGVRPSFSRGHGGIHITSIVECKGPTGVEMEALTSAMSASLTVYDMCKAVDRDMIVDHGTVMYKSGGRSGLHADHCWVKHRGERFFKERGLEIPVVRRVKREAGSGLHPQRRSSNHATGDAERRDLKDPAVDATIT